MSSGTLLRGSCHCRRNQYSVQIPDDASERAQVLFDSTTDSLASAAPLSAFLRVPLDWYHSRVFSFFPDESPSFVRRVYTHPAEPSSMRQFCGICGTPLSYWSEEPRTEADFIQLTLGSLLTEDLRDLEEMGLVPSEPEQDPIDIESAPPSTSSQRPQLTGQDTAGITWFQDMIAGSRLGNMHITKGVHESRDRTIRVEYEITEWAEEDETEVEEEARGQAGDSSEPPGSPAKAKRKREGEDVSNDAAVRGAV
ncbi:hypothetical protein GGS23DRAFT_453523 [Durotheca rogersii]|uniref:uncharacterized protein n=1 Tax=Durotheca rogersii TaxID=419775 RepID=UPI00221ED61E|nr:uncharacterized protein GGS23DRAFT_453523 [Durotheca rogersii]KAI5864572.1 hypothetical protein GGS23DRAFT_453523 [Durotheca rogersii]